MQKKLNIILVATFFFFHTIQGGNKQKTQFRTLHHTCSRRRKTTKMNWHTGCQFSYKPGLFNNHMGNTNHMTMKTRSRQKIQISQPSTIMPIRSCFHLEDLQKLPAVVRYKTWLKPWSFAVILASTTVFQRCYYSLQKTPVLPELLKLHRQCQFYMVSCFQPQQS